MCFSFSLSWSAFSDSVEKENKLLLVLTPSWAMVSTVWLGKKITRITRINFYFSLFSLFQCTCQQCCNNWELSLQHRYFWKSNKGIEKHLEKSKSLLTTPSHFWAAGQNTIFWLKISKESFKFWISVLNLGMFIFCGLTRLTSRATSRSWTTDLELHYHIYLKRSIKTCCFFSSSSCFFHLVYFFSLTHHRICMSASGRYSSSNSIWDS